MHRLLVLYPQPTDPVAFDRYYVDSHLPLVAKLPGMTGHRYSLDVQGDATYHAVFEADFPDAGTLGAAMASPEGQAVQADVPNYASGGAIVINYPVG